MKNTEEWLTYLMGESERRQNLILNLRLNDAAGLGGALDRMIRRGKSNRPAGLLLTGPAGAGKHNAAWHVLQAMEAENCAPIFLSGEALTEFRGDFPSLAAGLNSLLDRFYDRGQDLCLLLERTEESGLAGQLYNFLGRTLRDYQSYPAGDPSLFLILIAEEQPPLPSLLRELLLLCPCAMPDLQRRTAYLNERGRTIQKYVSLERLAELSEGCSYAALGQITDMLGFEIDATEQVPDEEALLRCIRLAAPETQAPKVDPVAEALLRLETVFSGLKDALNGLDLRRAETSASITKQEEPIHEISAVAKSAMERREFEEMSVSQLSTELFGEDRAQALLQN